MKALCRRTHGEKVDAAPKGVINGFRDNSFANPAGLVKMAQGEGPRAKVRPAMRIAFLRDFESPADPLEETREILEALVTTAEKKAA